MSACRRSAGRLFHSFRPAAAKHLSQLLYVLAPVSVTGVLGGGQNWTHIPSLPTLIQSIHGKCSNLFLIWMSWRSSYIPWTVWRMNLTAEGEERVCIYGFL